jgi:hypothetical protein
VNRADRLKKRAVRRHDPLRLVVDRETQLFLDDLPEHDTDDDEPCRRRAGQFRSTSTASNPSSGHVNVIE